MMLMST